MRWRFRKKNRYNVRRRRANVPVSIVDRMVKWGIPFFAVMVMVAASWAGWRFLHSFQFFGINRVVISGPLKMVQSDQLVSLLALDRESNIFFVELPILLERIKRHPWVKSAAVERLFPHTLVIRVIEQDPIAILATPQYYYINRDGEIFKKLEAGEDINYPIFVMPANADESSVGEDFKKNIHQMIDFLSKYDETRFAKEFGVSEVLWRGDGFTIFTEESAMQLEFTLSRLDEELWKLDKYYPQILVQGKPVGVLDLQVRGKVIASARAELGN